METNNNQTDKKKKIDWDRVNREACRYLRISGTWYRKCLHPVTNEVVLEHYRAEDVIKDYGKDEGPLILDTADKYINYVNLPDHLNYTEDITSKSGDHYYNIYRPIKHRPQAGGRWTHIERLIRHIFGEQFEMGLDYVQLLYLQPMKRLPVLVLVSRENGTGKSTFCNFLHALFGENCCQITNDSLRSNFNSTWVNKLLVYCEETLLDRREDSEKIKNLVTAFTIPSEAKGKDRVNIQTYIKFILCSNDEDRPIIINADDTRHWVRKVPPLTDKNPNEDFLEECQKEIPAFLFFLTQRQVSTLGHDRLWFQPNETRTEAWQRIVAGGMPSLAREMVEVLLVIMDTFDLSEIKYDAANLCQMIVNTGMPYSLKCPCSRIIIRDILRGWGLESSKTTQRYDYYVMLPDNTAQLKESKTGKVFSISKRFLESISL